MQKTTTLSNGLTVITDHSDHYVSTILTYWVKAGGNNEKNYPYGIAHFLEHMMFKGTKNRTKDDIKEEVDMIGGKWNASTWGEKTRYYINLPYDQWKTGVDILTDMVYQSTFPLDELEQEKGVVLEEIKRSTDDPSGYTYRQLIQHFMKERPERQSVLGTAKSVSSITQEDLKAFCDEFYQPSNMVFVAAGNIDHDALVAALETITPKTSKAVDSSVPAFEPFALNGETISSEKETAQAHVRWGMFAPTGHDKDAYVMEVITNLLSNRFFKLIREEIGAYAVGESYGGGNDTGYIVGYAGIDYSNLEKVKQVIIDEHEKLKTEELAEKELIRTKNSITGSYFIEQDYKETHDYNLAIDHMYGLGETPLEYKEKINAVTAEDIKRVAKAYFTPENLVFVQVVPKSN